MKNILVFAAAALLIGFLIWTIFFKVRSDSNPESPVTNVDTVVTTPKDSPCNGDAKLCPDGSSVGRTGPECQFAPCPPPDARYARIETYLGGRNGGLYLNLQPLEVISDTRCPPTVQCKEKGTVLVRVGIATQVGNGERIFRIGETLIIDSLKVTLVEVKPSTKVEVKTPENGYRFVFEVRK